MPPFPAMQPHCPDIIVESVGARLSSRGSLTLWASWEGAKPALLWQRMGKQLMLPEEKCFYNCLLSSFQRTEPHLFRMKNWDSMIWTDTRLITTTTAITTHLTKVRYVSVTELKAFHIVFHLIIPKQTSHPKRPKEFQNGKKAKLSAGTGQVPWSGRFIKKNCVHNHSDRRLIISACLKLLSQGRFYFKEAQGTFGSDENVLFLDWEDGYMAKHTVHLKWVLLLLFSLLDCH